jgi:hypothetical protein
MTLKNSAHKEMAGPVEIHKAIAAKTAATPGKKNYRSSPRLRKGLLAA